MILTDASGHSKLGELIGKAVSSAVKQALMNQTAADVLKEFSLKEQLMYILMFYIAFS